MLKITMIVSVWLLSSLAQAETSCHCAELGGPCQATSYKLPTNAPGARFKLQASTQDCAVVEWSVNGRERGVTTIWDDGEEVIRTALSEPDAQLTIHSCRVCLPRDIGDGASEAAANEQPTTSGNCKKLEFVSHNSGTIGVSYAKESLASLGSASAVIKNRRARYTNYVLDEEKRAATVRHAFEGGPAEWTEQMVVQDLEKMKLDYRAAKLEEPKFKALLECVERMH